MKNRDKLKDKFTSFNNAQRHRIESADEQEVFHIAVIDYLQEWNLSKKLERFAKCTLKGKDREQVSAVPPN